jgi:hypothetical protein
MTPLKQPQEEKKVREEKVRDDDSYVDNPNGMYDNPDRVGDSQLVIPDEDDESEDDEPEDGNQDSATTDPDYGDVEDAHKHYRDKSIIQCNTGTWLNPACLTSSNYVRFESKEGNAAETLRARLSRDNIDPQKLDAFLLKHKGVIAGSYPLQCVLGKNWIGCDIDVWVQANDEKANIIDSSMKEMGYRLSITRSMGGHRNRFKCATQEISRTPSIKDKISKFYQNVRQRVLDGYYAMRGIDTSIGQYDLYKNLPMEEKYAKEIEEYMRLETHVKTVSVYRAPDRPDIQVIITNCDTFAVVDSFDISVCRVAYNGEGVYIHPQTSLGVDQAFITPESAALQTPAEWIRTQKRMIKYSRRGFKIDATELVKFIDGVHAKGLTPMIKFISRWNREMISKLDDDIIISNRVADTNIPIFHNYYLKPIYGVQPRNLELFQFNIEANRNRIRREHNEGTTPEERFDPYFTDLCLQIYKCFFKRRSAEIGDAMDIHTKKREILREWGAKRDPLTMFIKEHDIRPTVRVISAIKVVVAFGIVGQKPLRVYELSAEHWSKLHETRFHRCLIKSVSHGGDKVLRLLRVREKFFRGRFFQDFSRSTSLRRSGPDVHTLVSKFIGPVPQWIDILLEYPDYYENLRNLPGLNGV